jgi:hypothetical protein
MKTFKEHFMKKNIFFFLALLVIRLSAIHAQNQDDYSYTQMEDIQNRITIAVMELNFGAINNTEYNKRLEAISKETTHVDIKEIVLHAEMMQIGFELENLRKNNPQEYITILTEKNKEIGDLKRKIPGDSIGWPPMKGRNAVEEICPIASSVRRTINTIASFDILRGADRVLSRYRLYQYDNNLQSIIDDLKTQIESFAGKRMEFRGDYDKDIGIWTIKVPDNMGRPEGAYLDIFIRDGCAVLAITLEHYTH